MEAVDRERLKKLFEAVLEVPAPERDSFLVSHAVSPEMLSELQSLLTVYQECPEFLEGAAAVSDVGGPDLLPGRRIGPWRLEREIGRGGMGVVWEALRTDEEYEQRVAIKLLPSALFSPTDHVRFREERQILARLNHPGIARLLDGGTASDGSPYLVMEYVDGQRLDEWCERDAPPLRDRLRLFISVCETVEYAHRHLVVHRDLKPANILVTAEGLAKLLDFGIARLLEAEGREGRKTATVRHLTPEYASPEQIRGEAVTTATDVYSMGVVLYRLLTGRSPYGAGAEDTLTRMRAICELDPPAPSTVAVDRQLRGELDAIVLQALRKKPENRYPSIRAMADDLAAWLDGRSVTAHRRPWWGEWLRTMRRHKTQTAAIASVVLSVLSGAAVSIWYARDAARERRVAEARFNDGRRLAHAVVFELQDAIAHLPGSTKVRQSLVQRVMEYLRRLEASGPDSRELKLELAAAYSRTGDIEGNPSWAHLGRTADAVDSETRARSLALDVLRSRPGDTEAEDLLAAADRRLERLEAEQGDSEQSERLWREEYPIRRRQAVRQPGNPLFAGRVRDMEAKHLAGQAKWADALTAYQQVASTYETALASDPRNLELGDRLSATYNDIARCWKELNRLPEALGAYRQAERLDRERLKPAAGNMDAEIDLSFDLVEAGWVEYRLAMYRQAIVDYERALAIQERRAAADADDVWMRLEAAKLLNTAAPAYEAAGRRDKAIQALTTAGARLEALLAADPGNEDTRLHAGWVWSNLVGVYLRKAQAGGGEAAWTNVAASCRRTLETLAKLRGEGRRDLGIDPRPMVAQAEAGLAEYRRHLDGAGR